MTSLNLTPSINHYTNLCVRFKHYLNTHLERPLYLYNSNLYGHETLFSLWLFEKCRIIDLDTYLRNKEVNYNRFAYYKSLSKYNNNKNIS